MMQQVAKMPGSNNISADFYRYVHYIETSQPVPVRVTFISLDDLKNSVRYFVERAISHPNLMKKFAEGVKRIYFVTPINCEKEMNFRKAIVYETQRQLNDLCGSFNAKIGWPTDRAINIVKFFGEIYNIEYIFHWILKKYLDIFKLNMEQSLISYRCFYVLVETVKNEVPKLSANDFSLAATSLREMIDKVEKNPMKTSERIKVVKILSESSNSSQLQVVLPPVTLQSIINKLNKENSKEILKKIAAYKSQNENETWQKCYESLIEKALSAPELSETVIVICKKIPSNNNSSWQKIKTEDYKKLINQLIVAKFEKLFDERGCGVTQIQAFRILNLIRKLMENSMCSIGCVAIFVDVLIRCAEKDNNLAAQILYKLMKYIKNGFSAEKIKKLPEEKREMIMVVLTNGALSRKFKAGLKGNAEYLGVEFDSQNDDANSEISADVSSSDDDIMTDNRQDKIIG